MSQRNDEINEQAAIWAARVACGNLAPDERSCFDAWLGADIRHVGAFARAQAILLRVGRLRAVGADALRVSIASVELVSEKRGNLLSDLVPEKSTKMADSGAGRSASVHEVSAKIPVVWTRRRMMLTGTTAASLAASGIMGGVMIWNDHTRKPVAAPAIEHFATRRGETQSVRLADGSVVTLNTNSKISVRYTETARNIFLEQGEALFKVAKNKKRPFVVTAADTVVRAVGTSFTVRFLPKRPVRILVQEGVVEVVHRGPRSSKPVRVAAATQSVVAANEPIAVRAVLPTQVERNLAWQYGQISFENETLGDAAEEFARYSDTKIAVDPAIAHRTITGMFASNDPVGFAKVAASVLDLHIEVEAKEVWIVR